MIPWFFISTLNSWSCLWHQCSWRSWAPDHFFRITRREIQKVAPITKISSKRLLKKEWKKKLLSFKKSESLLTSLSSLTKLGRSKWWRSKSAKENDSSLLLWLFSWSSSLTTINRVGTGHHIWQIWVYIYFRYLFLNT